MEPSCHFEGKSDPTMANDATTTTKAATFGRNHLVRLRGMTQAAFNGKLVRIEADIDKARELMEVVLLDDRARPAVPAVPERRLVIKPNNMRHACEYCLVAVAVGK